MDNSLVLVDNLELNEPAWQEWLEYRKEKKKPVSKLAAKKQIKMLCQYDEDEQQAIIDQSIMNDWQGLFQPKKNQLQTQSKRTRDRSLLDDLTDTSWAH